MRRTIAFILVLFLSFSVFSAVSVVSPNTDSKYSALLEGPDILSARSKAMGGVSVVSISTFDGIFNNPAVLARHELDIAIPYFEFTFFNYSNLIRSGLLSSSSSGYTEDIISQAVDFVSYLGIASKLMRIDTGVAFTTHGFGFGIAIEDTVHTYSSTGSYITEELLNQLNIVFTAGYGYRFYLPLGYSLDVGASVSLNYLMYNDMTNLSVFSFVNSVMGEGGFNFGTFFAGIPFMAGASFPVNLSLIANMPLGFAAGINLRNILGAYSMKSYSNFDDIFNLRSGIEEFSFWSNMYLDLGGSWEFEYNDLLYGVIELDFVDLIGFKDHDFNWKNFCAHFKLGLELDIYKTFDIRLGFNQGYFSVGLGLNVVGLRVDIAYFREEYLLNNSNLGDNGVDGFTIRFILGYNSGFLPLLPSGR